MHAVFKDSDERVVDSRVDIHLEQPASWLRTSDEATVCEVYEDAGAVRGELVVTFVREAKSGRWRKK